MVARASSVERRQSLKSSHLLCAHDREGGLPHQPELSLVGVREVTTCDLVIASQRLSNLGVVTLCLRVPNELQSRRSGLAPWTPGALVTIGVATRDALAAADDHVLPEACLVDTVGATDRSSGRDLVDHLLAEVGAGVYRSELA